jgi:hypothetical protein
LFYSCLVGRGAEAAVFEAAVDMDVDVDMDIEAAVDQRGNNRLAVRRYLPTLSFYYYNLF